MRAGGLLAGSLLLVAGWFGWLVTSGPSRGPLALGGDSHASAPRRETPQRAPRAEREALPDPGSSDPLRATPVLAETLEGDSVADVARDLA